MTSISFALEENTTFRNIGGQQQQKDEEDTDNEIPFLVQSTATSSQFEENDEICYKSCNTERQEISSIEFPFLLQTPTSQALPPIYELSGDGASSGESRERPIVTPTLPDIDENVDGGSTNSKDDSSHSKDDYVNECKGLDVDVGIDNGDAAAKEKKSNDGVNAVNEKRSKITPVSSAIDEFTINPDIDLISSSCFIVNCRRRVDSSNKAINNSIQILTTKENEEMQCSSDNKNSTKTESLMKDITVTEQECWLCDKCKRPFSTYEEAIEHEKGCMVKNSNEQTDMVEGDSAHIKLLKVTELEENKVNDEEGRDEDEKEDCVINNKCKSEELSAHQETVEHEEDCASDQYHHFDNGGGSLTKTDNNDDDSNTMPLGLNKDQGVINEQHSYGGAYGEVLSYPLCANISGNANEEDVNPCANIATVDAKIWVTDGGTGYDVILL